MKITKRRLKEIILEEMGTAVPVDKSDPWRSTPQSPEECAVQVQKASRLLEDLPLEDLPESVTKAAQNLRDALDLMQTPDQAGDPHVAGPSGGQTSPDIYTYLNEDG